MRLCLIGLILICAIQTFYAIKGADPPFRYDELIGGRLSVLEIFQPEDADRQRPMVIELSNAYNESWWTTYAGFQDSTLTFYTTECYRDGLYSINSRIGFMQNTIAYRKENWAHKPAWTALRGKMSFDTVLGSTELDAGYTGVEDKFFLGEFDHLVPIGDYGLQISFQGVDVGDRPYVGGLCTAYSGESLRLRAGAFIDSDDKAAPWLGLLWHSGNRFLISGNYRRFLQIYPYQKWFDPLELQWESIDKPEDTDEAIVCDRIDCSFEFRLGETKHRIMWNYHHTDSRYEAIWQNDIYTIVQLDESVDRHQMEYSFDLQQLSLTYLWRDDERFEFYPAHQASVSWGHLIVPFVYLGFGAEWQHDIRIQGETYDQYEYGASVSYQGLSSWIFTLQGEFCTDDIPERELEVPYQITLSIAYRQGEYERLHRED